MKKLFTLLAAIIVSNTLLAQAPQKMSYQAVIRNSSNAIVVSKPVGMRVTILQGSATGTEVYKEIYNPNPETNANGLVSIEIGGGVPLTGTFAAINWANGPYFIRIETDPNGGTAYSITGTSQLLSVPYALYAGNVVNGGGKPILYISGDINNTQAQTKIAAEVGSNTQQIIIDNCTALTTIDLSMITGAVSIEINNNENLQSINLSKLETCRGIEVGNCPKLNMLNLTGLKQLGYLNLNQTALTSLSLTSLLPSSRLGCDVFNNKLLTTLSISNITKAGYIYIGQSDALTSVSFPALTTAEGINVSSNNILSSVNFQSLRSVLKNQLSFSSNGALTSLSFPQLQSVPGVGIYNNNNLTSIQLPSLTNFNALEFGEYYFSLYNNKLPSSQINTLLNKLVNLTPSLTGSYISLSGQNPAAPPTGQGLTDKATLISRGNQVSTD